MALVRRGSRMWKELYYDEGSPSCLKWAVEVRSGRGGATVKMPVHSDAGTMVMHGYWAVRVNGKRTMAHRIVWEIFNGKIPDGMYIDHLDQNKQNNKLENLRLVTFAQNCRNRPMQPNNSSGVTGVSLRKTNTTPSSWVAEWTDLQGKNKSKWFSVKKYGYKEAFSLALEARQKAIAEINEQDAGYTPHHGKGDYH